MIIFVHNEPWSPYKCRLYACIQPIALNTVLKPIALNLNSKNTDALQGRSVQRIKI